MARRVLALPTVALVLLFIASAPAPGAAGQRSPAAAQEARLVATAAQVDTPPAIDGDLGDRAWQAATPLTGFTQAEPEEGAPASEPTEVRIVFDDEAVYVGVACHDDNPSQIVTTDTRRDSDLGGQDAIGIIFDTFHDQQNGFVFGTNSAGSQFDGQVRDQGGVTTSWDGSWEVKTHVGADAWTAEFRIPLRTLRYGPAPQVWGVNVARNIQRHRERAFWSPVARIYDIQRLSSAGELQGLRLKTPRNLKVLPYAVSSAERSFVPGAEVDFDGNAGIDAKVGVTPSLNLDLSYNTDFAQVEVDTQQINLTRFNLRFPEKRPFFLENSGLFRVGKGDLLDLFFSRRIGLDQNGGLVPIAGGGRLSGKAGGFNLGALNMQTEAAAGSAANNFSVFRVSRELPQRSGLGFIFVNRSATGALANNGDWNRTWGGDARLGIGEDFSIAAFAARTETPGASGREYAYNVDSYYDNGRHLARVEYGATGEGFNPEVGYLDRTGGYRRLFFRFAETLRQQSIRNLGFRQLLPHMTYTRYEYLDGGLDNAELHVDNDWDFENGVLLSATLNGTWDGLREPFEVYPGVVVPPGVHGGPRFSLQANSDRRKPVFLRFTMDDGRFLTGHQFSPSLQATVRRGAAFTVDATWSYRSFDLPEGRFRTNLGNARITYNFTPQVFVQSLVQYNDRTDRWSSNLRFQVLQTAGTGLFVVYNDTETLDGNGPVNRTFVVKYSRQFDLLN
ncbi:MAG: carbohydrate binding family 9 domain-containing protein [Acidobacteria bacterium]|nr:carbohydrate binding family 9 domain-containing protein [Acidobacteriota bacterium]